MPRYLIEVPHEDSKAACQRAMAAFYRTGSHFMTHADWGCDDGEHKAWLTVELESKDEARMILPNEFRRVARIITLTHMDADYMEKYIQEHGK